MTVVPENPDLVIDDGTKPVAPRQPARKRKPAQAEEKKPAKKPAAKKKADK